MLGKTSDAPNRTRFRLLRYRARMLGQGLLGAVVQSTMGMATIRVQSGHFSLEPRPDAVILLSIITIGRDSTSIVGNPGYRCGRRRDARDAAFSGTAVSSAAARTTAP